MHAEHLDAKSTALVLIDLQNGIVARPLEPHSSAQVIENATRLANAVREAGGTVVFVRVLLHEFLSLPVDTPMRAPDAPRPPASASELVAELDIREGDVIVSKRSWGAFYGTDLELHLRRRGIRTILLGGIATNFGVESTGRAAFDRGYQVVYVHDAMSTFNADAHRFALDNIFARCGRVRSTDEALDMLSVS
jgi:nicotinamidase-related amidase